MSELVEALERLDAITRRLRVECPWDREQTARTIVPHTVEEAYELADAAERDDVDGMRDELGDVLFQVVFLSLLLEERGEGDLATVADGLTEKLIRRHPHVFGDAEIETSGEVVRQWEEIKRDVEGSGEADPFAGIPGNLPALSYARKIQRRADPAGRAGEGSGGGAQPEPEAAAELIGELLYEAVAAARGLGVDPELALRSRAERAREMASDQNNAGSD